MTSDLRTASKAAIKLFRWAERVTITTHVQPDGDGIGSEVALAHWLRAQGKTATIMNPHPAPRRFRFLEKDIAAPGFDPETAERLLAESDVLAVLDISVPARLGPLEPFVREYRGEIVVIDHHLGPTGFRGVDCRDTSAAATAELLHDLLVEWGAEITPEMATALYAAIAYDTGGFRYSNTTARTHRTAADLIGHGADIHEINQRVFESVSPTRARLLSRVFGEFHLEEGGRLAWISLSSDLMEEAGAEAEDVEGVVESLRSLEHVEMAILFKEIDKGATKVSFRSAGEVDVSRLAGRFGGGGHKNAAGAFLKRPLAVVVEDVLTAARESFAVERVG
ncbi:MAG TPA: bifunctional oligoribonuclease/PAP phosphatase NrnA [Gemmatimonadota bacterium]